MFIAMPPNKKIGGCYYENFAGPIVQELNLDHDDIIGRTRITTIGQPYLEGLNGFKPIVPDICGPSCRDFVIKPLLRPSRTRLSLMEPTSKGETKSLDPIWDVEKSGLRKVAFVIIRLMH